jgi:hypothetical protein
MPAPRDSHLVRLASGQFGMWRSSCIRGAGLPYDWLADGRAQREPLFAEALAWQHARVAAQLRGGPRRGDRDRQLARTLASYRTRYCAKNDSIGYYGPLAWAEWTDGDTCLTEFVPPQRGEALFELWAVRAVGEALTERHRLADYVVPHRAPAVGVAGRDCYLPDGSRLELTELQQRIVAACDGFRTAAEVTGECAGPGVADRGRVAAVLRQLQAVGVITTGFVLGQSPHPEQQLRAQLWRVADPARREAAAGELDELTEARDLVTKAIGDPVAVAEAIAGLGDKFAALTGLAPRRRDGEFYAGRTLVYEECASDRPSRLGRRLLDGIGPALELALTSVRWLTAEVSRGYQDQVRRLVTADGDRHPGGYPLPLVLSRLSETTTAAMSAPLAELRRRWTAILVGDFPGGRRELSSAAIRDQVLRAFPASGPGWPSARWHSPDLMIAAASAADVAADRYLAVLGELHAGVNTLDQKNFETLHPDPPSLRRWIDADMPWRMVPAYPAALINSRTAPPDAYLSPSYCYLGMTGEPPYPPKRARLVPAGALRVHLEGGRVVVRSCVDDFTADLVEVMDDMLSAALFDKFGFLLPRPHQPRVQVDRLVLTRETWRLPFAEFAVLEGARLPRVVAEMNRVRDEFALPNPVFCRVAGESKPVYLDFDDPSIVDMTWHKLRRGRARRPAGEIVMSEMLPGPDQLWRRDAAGCRYTSEFRLVCVDSVAYQHAGSG